MAIIQLQVNNNFSDNSSLAGSGESSSSQNQIGWATGIGLETVFVDRLSFIVEYLFVYFPSAKTTHFISNTQAGFGIPLQSLNSPFSTTGQVHANSLKIGLSYRF